jgi:hypothetical protein
VATEPVKIVIPSELYTRLKRMAALRTVPIEQLVISLVEKWLQEREKAKEPRSGEG